MAGANLMRDLHLGFRLDFSTPEAQRKSEEVLLRILGVNCLLNLMYLDDHPETPALYDSDVVYTEPDQCDGRPPFKQKDMQLLLEILRRNEIDEYTALMIVRMLKGIEIFLDIPGLYRRGKGDCNELAPVRVAELWRAGVLASPYLTKAGNDRGGISYHCVVLYPDGSSEDVSLILGMGNSDRADERREEIRKNNERWERHMIAAASSGEPLEAAARRVELMGFLPRSGVFKSPYSIVGGRRRAA